MTESKRRQTRTWVWALALTVTGVALTVAGWLAVKGRTLNLAEVTHIQGLPRVRTVSGMRTEGRVGWMLKEDERLETTVLEAARLRLADDTEMVMDSETIITMRETGGLLDIYLEHGRLLLLAVRPHSMLRVNTPDAWVQTRGPAQIQVHFGNEGLKVLLLSGEARLDRGEGAGKPIPSSTVTTLKGSVMTSTPFPTEDLARQMGWGKVLGLSPTN